MDNVSPDIYLTFCNILRSSLRILLRSFRSTNEDRVYTAVVSQLILISNYTNCLTTLLNYIITTAGYSTLYLLFSDMSNNTQKKAAISARKYASSPISNDGFTTINCSKTNATNDMEQTIDQAGRTHGGSAYGPTPIQARTMISKLTSMDPEDEDNSPSVQVPKEQTKENVDSPSKTSSRDSLYRAALKTPIQPIRYKSPQLLSPSVSQRPHLEELKKDSAKEFNNLHTIMTAQNSMMLSL